MNTIQLNVKLTYNTDKSVAVEFDNELGYLAADCLDSSALLEYKFENGKLIPEMELEPENLGYVWNILPLYVIELELNKEFDKFQEDEHGQIIDQEGYDALDEIWSQPEKSVVWYFNKPASEIYEHYKSLIEIVLGHAESVAKEYAKIKDKRLEAFSGELKVEVNNDKEVYMVLKDMKVWIGGFKPLTSSPEA